MLLEIMVNVKYTVKGNCGLRIVKQAFTDTLG